MIEQIIEYCAKNRFLVLICTGLIIAWALWTLYKTPIDALPDISDTQVIIFTEWMGRSPTLVEDQITYPLITTFLNAPAVKVVRGITMFGMSFVFVIFEDGTDLYWARSRVLEYLSKVQGKLPEGVTPQLGPDATGVGWVYQYALVDETNKHSLQELRSFQDWHLRYWLSSVPGVAEVASVGGYVKEYQVELDPVKLQAYRLSITTIKDALRMSNNEVGGRVIELAEHEYAIRGRGYITNKDMLEHVVVGTDEKGTPILIKDIGHVQIGGNMRRGCVELNGEGEVAGGIVVMRYGENAFAVIDRVKRKLQEMQSSFPPGVKPIITYDRSNLIKNSLQTLFNATIEEVIAVSLIIFLFLFHIGSALIAILAFILSCLFAFIPMYYLGLTSNIMSLAGIIIAMGDVVDNTLVMIENAHHKLELKTDISSPLEKVLDAAKELGPDVFSSSLISVIAFLPVFTLQAQEGKLFSPLAFTKVFTVFFGALLGITLVPALMVLLIRGNIRPSKKNPINIFCITLYRPLLHFCVRFRYWVVFIVTLLMILTIPIFLNLGSEFMPPLDEEDIFFMPITVSGISIEAAKELLQKQNKILKSFPEVALVFGKAGRAETSTDPAPLSMMETIITLHPKSKWRPGMTKKRLLEEIDKALQFPGVQNALTMPIKARIDMLTTGIRTPVGIKIFGKDFQTIQSIGEQIEQLLRKMPMTRSVYATRELDGFYIDFIPDRQTIARYGLRIMDIFDVIETAVGGLDVTTTIEERERYKINIRYPRELRDSIDQLKNILIPIQKQGYEDSKENSSRFEQIPLGLLGEIKAAMGPAMIKNEMGELSGWIFVDSTDEDIGGYVQRAKQKVSQNITLPAGYHLKWTGQYEYLERARGLMKLVIPLTLFIIFLLLFLQFASYIQTLMIMLSVPFAALGSIWMLFAYRYNMSIPVWVGMISLLGVAAELVAMMMIYLNQGYNEWSSQGRLKEKKDLENMTIEHALLRVRPLLMSILLDIVGLVPIMLSSGVGADIAQHIAAPLWGGLISATILTLLVIPPLYVIWRDYEFEREIRYGQRTS